jgi:predicted DNA-binding transcriptional regulator YafY
MKPMRADRLVAALLILQARGRVSAAELARELEVSVKTARRDLEALAIAGIPVYAQPGRNGGWSLVGDATTDLSGLTAAEARTLFLLAGPSARVAPEAKAALRKLVRALPEPFRAEATAAAGAVVIDAARWGRSVAPAPRAFEALQVAIVEGVQVRMGYADRSGKATERTVHPLGLVQKGQVWYLMAGTDAGLRTFRVDRVTTVVPTSERVVRPEGFDLEAAWSATRRRTEERRRRKAARVHVRRTHLAGLREQFGDDMSIVRELDDERVEIEVRTGTFESLANELAGWGDDLEVIGPQAVRDRLAGLGAELVRRYGSP